MTRALVIVAAIAGAVIAAASPASADTYWNVFDEQVASAPRAQHSPYPCDKVDNPEFADCLDEAEATFMEEYNEAEDMKWRRYDKCEELELTTDECINWFTSAYNDEVDAAEARLQEAMDDCEFWYGE